MMKPHEHSPRLLAYLDRQLSDRESEAVENHLAACTDCRRELQSLRALQEQLEESRDSFELNLWPEIASRLPARSRARGLTRLGYALLVLVGLGLGAFAGWTSVGGTGPANSLDYLAESSLLDSPQASFSESYLAALSDGETGVSQ
jgi:anti-sigma factor RsiW